MFAKQQQDLLTERMISLIALPKVLQGLLLLVTPFLLQQFKAIDDRRSLKQSLGVACFGSLFRLPREWQHGCCHYTLWVTFVPTNIAIASVHRHCAA